MKTRLFIILMVCLLVACDKDDVGTSNELKGRWNWTSTCGGFAGCVNSTPDNQMTMKITETDIVETVSNKNGTNSTSTSYQLIDKQSQGGNTIYTVKLANETYRVMTVNKDNLSSGSDFISTSYTRLR